MSVSIDEEVTVVSPSLRYRLEVVPDDDPSNPREDDNVAELWCWHRRYTLGDEKLRLSRDPLSSQDLIERIKEDGDTVVEIAPLYLYDHSGITMRTSPFSCAWDSGQVGWAFVRGSKAAAEGHPDDTAWARRLIDGEVETYDQFLTGDVYGFRILRETLDEDGDVECSEEMDACWGFYGREYCLEEARGSLASVMASRFRKRLARLKEMILAGVPLAIREQKLGPAFA